jgi:hypothetical protein
MEILLVSEASFIITLLQRVAGIIARANRRVPREILAMMIQAAVMALPMGVGRLVKLLLSDYEKPG